jgi:hypothetical protein
MKKMFFIMLAVAFSAASFGQNISGNWKLNESKSKLNEQFSLSPKSCKITQTDNELVIEKKSEFQGQAIDGTEKYTLDGKECTNPGFMETTKKSTVTISDDKKSVKITSKTELNDGGFVESVEVFSINGDNLMYDFKSTSSFGDLAETAVYDKI